MNHHMRIKHGVLTPVEQLRSAEKRVKCWEQLKKILPSLENHPDDIMVYITEHGHYVTGSNIFEMIDSLKEQSPQDYLGAFFELRRARQWSYMGQ